ncbi:hypothetical protein GGR55DRAFT_663869 [Xylaria sp. FL0064]|nr:hypothetical protein GGR55DRAFT_663869 [Xylaria sp. FL0064]
MRALRRCGVLSVPHSLGLHRALYRTLCTYRTLHAHHRLGLALSGPAPRCSSIEVPRRWHPNGITAAALATPHQRHFSSTRRAWSKLLHRHKWLTPPVSKDVYGPLESHLLDVFGRGAEGFPSAPAASDPNPRITENRSPPSPAEPDRNNPHPRKTYDALVIACEFVEMQRGSRGLLSISAVDFFTGDVVLHKLVWPGPSVINWHKPVTRFNKARLNDALKKGKALSGWEQAREKIFEVANSQTIFIGHGLAPYLNVLRIATDRAVDSMVMLSRAVFGDMDFFPRRWYLDVACRELLKEELKHMGSPRNSLEDALATRELVLQGVLLPERLEQWAAKLRAILAQEQEEKDERYKERVARREARLEKKRLKEAEREKMTPEELMQEAAEKARLREEERAAAAAKRVAQNKVKMEKKRRTQIKKRAFTRPLSADGL